MFSGAGRSRSRRLLARVLEEAPSIDRFRGENTVRWRCAGGALRSLIPLLPPAPSPCAVPIQLPTLSPHSATYRPSTPQAKAVASGCGGAVKKLTRTPPQSTPTSRSSNKISVIFWNVPAAVGRKTAGNNTRFKVSSSFSFLTVYLRNSNQYWIIPSSRAVSIRAWIKLLEPTVQKTWIKAKNHVWFFLSIRTELAWFS